MEVAPGIHRIQTVLWDRFLCVYALHGETTLLVDSGTKTTPTDTVFPYLARLGVAPADVRSVVDTHCHADHAGGNAAVLAQAPDATIVAHQRDARWIAAPAVQLREHYVESSAPYGWSMPADYVARIAGIMGPAAPVHRPIEAATEVPLAADWSVQIIPTPGHTPGHVVVFDRRSGALIAGDGVNGAGDQFVGGRFRAAAHYVDVAAYRSSLAQIRALGVDLLLTAHFPVLGGPAAHAFVEESLAHVARCEEATLGAVGSARQPAGLPSIAAAVREQLGGYGMPMSWYPAVRAHLEDLTARRLILRTVVDGVYAWKPVS